VAGNPLIDRKDVKAAASEENAITINVVVRVVATQRRSMRHPQGICLAIARLAAAICAARGLH